MRNERLVTSRMSPGMLTAHRIELARVVALCALGGGAIPLYQKIIDIANDRFAQAGTLGWLLFGISLIYLGALFLILRTGSTSTLRLRQGEWLVIIGVGLALRVICYGAPPMFSHDAYRYVWDAHLIANGVSPYTHVPIDPTIAALRDMHIWPLLDWRDVPTIYPPGAQALGLLANLISPLNIWSVKLLIALCDLGAGILTVVLLRQHGLDPRRAIIYWWSPVPILEFAFNAHIDGLAIVLVLGALLFAHQSATTRNRLMVGVLLGLATLVKIYPLLFVVAIVRRRDWGMFVGLVGTIILGYLPFIPLGLGGGGFLTTYFRQRFVDQGFIEKFLGLTIIGWGGTPGTLALVQFSLIGGLCLLVGWWRWRVGFCPEVGIIAVTVIWLVLAPHVFPWYVATLLPVSALYLRVPRATQGDLGGNFASLTWAIWLFVLMMPFQYVIFTPGLNPELFQLFFYIPLAVALVPLLTPHGRATSVSFLANLRTSTLATVSKEIP